MPWKKQDVESHIKGLDDKQKAAWVKIANSTLSSCLDVGGNQKDCEGKAIRIANAMSKKVKENMGELTEIGKTISAATAEKLKAARDAIDELLSMVEAEIGEDPNLSEAVTKSEDGKAFPASDYAYVPDPDKPSTWKLRLTATPGGGPDSGIVGAACAALGKGFRGNKVDIPAGDLAAVKAKVRAAWKKANPDKEADEMPDAIKESEDTEIIGDYIPLVEQAVRKDGTIPIRVIAPGWGTSGYYSPEVLERDGPTVFTKGLHMHLDHPTVKEEAERPERSVKDLAAVLVDNAMWNSEGIAGPGLYADAKVFEPYQAAINELAPHIGVSIRAVGKASHGEVEGRKGTIIEGITAAKSVDFVTAAGAGGEILQLFEAARDRLQNRLEEYMNEEDVKALQEAKAAAEAENARLKEALLLREAEDFARETLAKIEMPDMTRGRLVGTLAKSPPVAEGKLDTEKFETLIKEAAKTELEYLAKVSGSGIVREMGARHTPGGADLKESYKNYYQRQGKSSEEAEKLATLAVGR